MAIEINPQFEQYLHPFDERDLYLVLNHQKNAGIIKARIPLLV